MLILCCGNADRGDDGAGPACADALRMLHAPSKCLPGDAFSLLDAWTGQPVEGHGWVKAPAPLEHIPVYLRGGGALKSLSGGSK